MKDVDNDTLERGKLRRAVGAFYCRHCCSGTHLMVAQGIRDDLRGSDPRSCLVFQSHTCWAAICIGHACLRSAMQAEGIAWEWYSGHKVPIPLRRGLDRLC